MSPSRANTFVMRAVLQEFLWKFRPLPAPIHEVIAEQNAIRAGIGPDVFRIGAAVGQTVMGVGLAPVVIFGITGIDVVTERLFLAAAEIGLLLLEPGIAPILLKGHRFGHPRRGPAGSGA